MNIFVCIVCCTQEVEFEKLTRELAVEKRSVADQLHRVRDEGSETASFKSIRYEG